MARRILSIKLLAQGSIGILYSLVSVQSYAADNRHHVIVAKQFEISIPSSWRRQSTAHIPGCAALFSPGAQQTKLSIFIKNRHHQNSLSYASSFRQIFRTANIKHQIIRPMGKKQGIYNTFIWTQGLLRKKIRASEVLFNTSMGEKMLLISCSATSIQQTAICNEVMASIKRFPPKTNTQASHSKHA